MEKIEIKDSNEVNLSYVHSDSQPSSCGYCKEDEIKKKTSYKIGFSCDEIHACDYETLMFNGFRKCGTYYYKPNLEKSCCQLHSIRLNVNEFEISTSQKKIMKKLRKFMSGNIIKAPNNNFNTSNTNELKDIEHNESDQLNQNQFDEIEKIFGEIICLDSRVLKILKLLNIDLNLNYCNSSTSSIIDVEGKSLQKLKNYILYNKNKDCYSCNIFNIIYHKIIALEKQISHDNKELYFELSNFSEGKTIFEKENYNSDTNLSIKEDIKRLNPCNLKSFLTDKLKSIVNKYNAEIIKDEFEKKLKINSENLFINIFNTKFQSTNHLNLDSSLKLKLNSNLTLKSKESKDSDSEKIDNKKEDNNVNINNQVYKFPYFQEILDSPVLYLNENFKHYIIVFDDAGEESKFKNEKFELYKKYQVAVHKDKEETLSFEKYLDSWGKGGFKKTNYDKVDLVINDSENSGTDNLDLKKFTHYGAYNLLHYIGEQLIAVSVLDILPTSTSSVYCYYDPDLSKQLNLGVVTAIREIEFTKFLQRKIKNSKIKYYFMGYYVQTCQKMVYKGEYYPSQVLCPVTKIFVYLNDFVKKLIDKSKKGCRLLFNKKTDDKLSEPSNEQLIPELSKERLEEIYQQMKIKYGNKILKLDLFIKRFISEKHHSNLIESVKLMIRNFGEQLCEALLFSID
jgi:arginine-tRNA-protein transferase